jgi:hypothetical protein
VPQECVRTAGDDALRHSSKQAAASRQQQADRSRGAAAWPRTAVHMWGEMQLGQRSGAIRLATACDEHGYGGNEAAACGRSMHLCM